MQSAAIPGLDLFVNFYHPVSIYQADVFIMALKLPFVFESLMNGIYMCTYSSSASVYGSNIKVLMVSLYGL